MSINFQNDVNPEAEAMLKEMFPKAMKGDDRTFLLDEMPVVKGPDMSKLANTAKQKVTIELNSLDDIKEMSDGTKYIVTSRGWQKLP